MKEIEKILRTIKDNKWHDLNKIDQTTTLPKDKLTQIIKFLENQKFATLNKKRDKIRITKLGIDYIKLPP